MNKILEINDLHVSFDTYAGEVKAVRGEVGSQPCRSVSQGVGRMFCLPKTAWPPTCDALDPKLRR